MALGWWPVRGTYYNTTGEERRIRMWPKKEEDTWERGSGGVKKIVSSSSGGGLTNTSVVCIWLGTESSWEGGGKKDSFLLVRSVVA